MEKEWIRRYKKIIILLTGLAALIVFYFAYGHKYFSLNALKMHQEALQDFVSNHIYVAPLLFILLYIACIAFCVPAETALSLLGGFLFLQPLSAIYVIFASSTGAILVFLLTRTMLSNLLKRRAGPFLKKMETEFTSSAASYMLFLRFVHIVPFWVINLASACFGIPFRTFLWTTLAGVIPTSIMLTLIGSGLQDMLNSEEPLSITSMLNPQIEVALVLLGILALIPVVIKKMKKA